LNRPLHTAGPGAGARYALQCGMTQITLVLPFALPPAGLAPDLVRALQAPALAALITRTSAHQAVAHDAQQRALPHELWLARALGLPRLAFAAPAMRGYGLDPADGTWFIVNPAHIEIARSHLLMSDLRRLGLADADSRALFDAARPYFDEAGHTLLYGDAQTWFMRADSWAGLDMASPDAAAGLNLTDWLPTGARAIEYRKLQNEVQMLWFEHPANLERAARGLAAVNSFWPWAGAAASDAPSSAAALATSDAPAWLSALAQRPEASLPELIADSRQDTILYCGSVSEAAIATDWSGWLLHMQRLDELLFAPALAALAAGRIGQLRLVLSHREAHAEFTTTRMAQRKFWRRPTLKRLLP
jgi:hypothetical protein